MQVYTIDSGEEFLDFMHRMAGRDDWKMLKTEHVDQLNPEGALHLAKINAASADNVCVLATNLAKPGQYADDSLDGFATVAELLQDQAKVWLDVYDRLLTAELRANADAQMRGYRQHIAKSNDENETPVAAAFDDE